MPLSKKTSNLKKSKLLVHKNLRAAKAQKINTTARTTYQNLAEQEEILLAAILKKPREFLITHPQAITNLNLSQQKKFAAGAKLLRSGMPLAYVLAYKWFINNQFFVNENVLIPRPETEMLVEKALQRVKKTNPQVIIDVGTGSGAIIISVAEALLQKNITKTKLFATDISAKALAIAKKNARNILKSPTATKSNADGKIKFLKGWLLNPSKKIFVKKQGANEHKILIIANLPYLSKKELLEKSIRHEPTLALYGGKSAAEKIIQLLKQVAVFRKKNPKLLPEILLEINYNQAKIIKNAAKKYLPGFEIEIYKDLSGFDRVVGIWSSGKPSKLLA
jgi:release factor glutamine methyltransferase